MIDFRDFYILYPGHPKYETSKLIEDDLIRIIVQKYEMIIFTNKGDVLGDPNFGASLEELLFETNVSKRFVEREITNQIIDYIPELFGIDFELKVEFVEDTNSFQNLLFIYFKLKDFEVYAQIGRTLGIS
jgi:hypothetical protein